MADSAEIQFRFAQKTDLSQIISLLADDELGSRREDASEPVSAKYQMAFNEITDDPNNELVVGVVGCEVVAVLQLTFIPNLTHQGAKRAQIEGVRVSSKERGQKMGRMLIEFALQRARENGCKIAQLTSNKTRGDAIRFYESLGFKATHEGMKLQLCPP